MEHETSGRRRRTREEWKRLVASWRRSGKPAGGFASGRGVVESTLRWWAWRLDRDGEPRATKRGGVALVPVRVVDVDGHGGGAAEQEAAGQRVVWTLRTRRGELHVYATHAADELRAAVATMLGGDA